MSSVQAFCWYVHFDPTGPSRTLNPRGDLSVFPFIIIIGGMLLPVALIQAIIVFD
jgi:hypothetical protein